MADRFRIAVWRILIGLSLIPAFGTLYQCLVLPESRRYKQAQENRELDEIADLKLRRRKGDAEREGIESWCAPSCTSTPQYQGSRALLHCENDAS